MSTRERSWLVPLALTVLSAIPLTAGTLRVIQLAGGPALIPVDHRISAFPLVLHIVGAAVYALVGTVQWMIRAYAIGLAAGTQSFTEGVGEAVFGTGVLTADLAKAAGWVINLVVAEWVVRRPTRGRAARPAPAQRAGALS